MIKSNTIKMKKEAIENLKECYKFVYVCDKCKTKYGSDKKENTAHLCPICEEKQSK